MAVMLENQLILVDVGYLPGLDHFCRQFGLTDRGEQYSICLGVFRVQGRLPWIMEPVYVLE